MRQKRLARHGRVLHGWFACDLARRCSRRGRDVPRRHCRLFERVPELFLEKYTAVSREVAEAMATGALKLCGADIAIAITGVAGPEPDEDGNPVGLAYVACATRAGQQRQIRLLLGDTDRSRNRERMMEESLTLLESLLDE